MISNTKKPLFISIEGVDGSGKTTQIQKLIEVLNESKIEHVLTREPGGCPQGKQLRKMLLEGAGDTWDGVSEALLFSVDRNEHLRHVIRPALAAGKWVISDRFADSTTVFQGEGRGISREDLLRLHNLVVQDTWPDLTLILDISFAEGLARKQAQASEEGLQETRFEELGSDFHDRVRQGFHRVSRENPQRCKLIDARGSIAEVHARMLEAIEQHIQQQEAA